MEFFDIVLLIIIGGFVLFGFWFGFFHTLGSLLGTVFGVYLASRYYEPMAEWLISITGWGVNISRVLMFVIAFIIINRLVGFGFWIIDKLLSIITRLPFISSINRLLGIFLGALEGMITVGFIIFFLERFPVSQWITNGLAHSVIAPYTIQIIDVLLPLLPEGLRLLESSVTRVQGVVL